MAHGSTEYFHTPHANTPIRSLKLCRHLPAQLSLDAFQEGRPVRVFRDLGHVALADVVHGMADAAFAISRRPRGAAKWR